MKISKIKIKTLTEQSCKYRYISDYEHYRQYLKNSNTKNNDCFKKYLSLICQLYSKICLNTMFLEYFADFVCHTFSNI